MQFDQLKRRDFITLVGGVAAIQPLAADAQQPAMPVVGLLSGGSPDAFDVTPFHQGLNESSYGAGRNVAIESRWAHGQFDQLPGLAADLVGRQAAVITTVTLPAAFAAMAATTTIPVVFIVGEDPLKVGLVTSLNRPERNVTGVSNFENLLVSKRLELLSETMPKPAVLAFLVNPNNPNAEPDTKEAQRAAHALGRQLQVLTARTEHEIDIAFASIAQTGALFVNIDSFFGSRRNQIVALAARHVVPAIYPFREHVAAGGLMSYGASRPDALRQAGAYAGRILKGAKPSDLPVMQPTKFEFVINLRAAKELRLEIPPKVLALAHEVIE
jgi:putative ABC transport system substrate-binding protein